MANDRDMSYLWDMKKFALEVKEVLGGIPHAKFVENKTVRYAIERLLLIIGEAAIMFQKNFKENIPRLNGLKSLVYEIFWHMNMAK